MQATGDNGSRKHHPLTIHSGQLLQASWTAVNLIAADSANTQAYKRGLRR